MPDNGYAGWAAYDICGRAIVKTPHQFCGFTDMLPSNICTNRGQHLTTLQSGVISPPQLHPLFVYFALDLSRFHSDVSSPQFHSNGVCCRCCFACVGPALPSPLFKSIFTLIRLAHSLGLFVLSDTCGVSAQGLVSYDSHLACTCRTHPRTFCFKYS